jgi:3-isopropylmalate/(R)-2-methylmalate dehydratase large subunit
VSHRADQVTISAINRNFPGRSGPGQVWLGSPETVAASAFAGRIMSFDQLKNQHPDQPEPAQTDPII